MYAIGQLRFGLKTTAKYLHHIFVSQQTKRVDCIYPIMEIAKELCVGGETTKNTR